MKKIILALTIFATLIISATTCAAKDVWVENDEGTDYYVMDDTITSYIKDDYRSFTVYVKYVKNNKLLKVVKWSFYKDNWWYFRPDEIRNGVIIDNYTPVPPKYEMFEICMKRLGWSYRIINNGGLVRYV